MIMARPGRKPTGAQLVERLEGSEHAKDRLKVILETLSGRQTIPAACEILGIQESMFHKMRSQVLQTAVGRLEPRPLGRPSQTLSPAEQRVAELEEENQRLRGKLHLAEVRHELAERLAGASKRAAGPGKKTTGHRPKVGRGPHPKRTAS
jgi:transposase-like protein